MITSGNAKILMNNKNFRFHAMCIKFQIAHTSIVKAFAK